VREGLLDFLRPEDEQLEEQPDRHEGDARGAECGHLIPRDRVTDRPPERRASLRGYTLGQCTCSQAPRLRDDNFVRAVFLEKELRHLRRLAAASIAGHDHDGVLAQGIE
jgi:hypothetical protein